MPIQVTGRDAHYPRSVGSHFLPRPSSLSPSTPYPCVTPAPTAPHPLNAVGVMAGSGWPATFATRVGGLAAAAGIGTLQPVFQEREGPDSPEELPPVLARTRVDKAKPLLVRTESQRVRNVMWRGGTAENEKKEMSMTADCCG